MKQRRSRSAWLVGEGSLVVQAGGIWRELGHRVCGVASRERSILAWAAEQGLACVAPQALREAASREPFDYLFSIVNLVRLPDAVLALPRELAVNFHDACLPRYAGANATVWALVNGEASHGVTWHEMTSGVDEGRIVVQQRFEIAPDETAFSLNAKCFTAGIETFRRLAEAVLEGSLALAPQDLAARSYFDFYARPADAMLLRFDEPAEDVARLVRALDFGAYPNPVGVPKALAGSEVLVVSEPEVAPGASGLPPGSVVGVDGTGFVVATTSLDLRLGRVRSRSGRTLAGGELAALLKPGTRLASPDAAARDALTAAYAQAARSEGFFLRRSLALEPLAFPLGPGSEGPPRALRAAVHVPEKTPGGRLPGLFACFAARKSGLVSFDVAYADPELRGKAAAAPALFASEVPLRVTLDPAQSLASLLEAVDDERSSIAARFPPASDLPARQPAMPREALPVALLVDVAPAAPLPESELTVLVSTASAGLELLGRSDRVSQAALDRLARRLALFLESARRPDAALGQLPLVSDEERRLIVESWNATAREVPEGACIHTLFEAQAARTPEAAAVTAGGLGLSYRELDRRANAVARELARLGVATGALVGVHVERGVHMLAAVLGVHKAGAAYVPLDPRYPRDRIRFMVEDARLAVILTDRASQAELPEGGFRRVLADDPALAAGADSGPAASVEPSSLAYVIYTSGSTGQPKGVMVEHRSVVNFFVAMDEVLRPRAAGTWLAVTSLSFDISVLELLWTVCRGFHVVLHAGHEGGAPPRRPIDFSAFYFSSDSSGGGPEHYRLLTEGARFADENGFVAVWTPERHFHAFGGLYPNPAVTSAALAMLTRRVALRAGSCVSPLHSPLRIAEEWALVDNLSNGRVGISFASGWQPNDFAIRPDGYARRKQQMFEDIESVRRLWRGEALAFRSGLGKDVAVRTLPRPVQKELPVWVTAAGSPETFEAAGSIGANLLTHLLGQSFEDVFEKVRVYRAAWDRAGHPGRGVVTLMLHSFVGRDEASVREAVRGPLKEYLKSAVGLIRDAAWSFPTFRQRIDQDGFSPDELGPEELDALVEHAFERYYATSGLFGTVETALRIVERVRELDVDEIACLIDFGVPAGQVLAHLPLLAEVHARANRGARAPAAEASVPELMRRHSATHFQCTPSMAGMLAADAAGRAALARLDAMLVGGEAFPEALANELRGLVKGALVNLYGPTETTVWSSSHPLAEAPGEVPIGRPLANTELLVLDAAGGLLPAGDEGELVIGGKGVARGYLGRDALTRERFVAHPLRPGERVYKTGDLASFGEDGLLRFRGRLDQQVKIRGHRVETGEIEARLAEHPRVRECAVVAREDAPGDKRLVAYVIARGAAPEPRELAEHLARSLPEPMLPGAFVFLDALPQTPNRKLDRKALPAPGAAQREPAQPLEPPRSSLEETIAAVWREVLGRADVGATDNFFDLGGHSLLTVRVLGRLKDQLGRQPSLVDLFRYPTIRSLAAFLDAPEQAAPSLDGSAERGAERQRIRRAMMERRRGR